MKIRRKPPGSVELLFMRKFKDNISLAYDKLWDDTPRLEGQGASEGP